MWWDKTNATFRFSALKNPYFRSYIFCPKICVYQCCSSFSFIYKRAWRKVVWISQVNFSAKLPIKLYQISQEKSKKTPFFRNCIPKFQKYFFFQCLLCGHSTETLNLASSKETESLCKNNSRQKCLHKSLCIPFKKGGINFLYFGKGGIRLKGGLPRKRGDSLLWHEISIKKTKINNALQNYFFKYKK